MTIKDNNNFEKTIDQFSSKNFVDILLKNDKKPVFIRNKNYRQNLVNQSFAKGKELPKL